MTLNETEKEMMLKQYIALIEDLTGDKNVLTNYISRGSANHCFLIEQGVRENGY